MENLLYVDNENTLKVALYCRLSKDDGDKAESNSITNQKALLQDYVINKLEDVKYYKEYVDDGYTGLNTNRPSFMSMIEDIKLGSINCVIVKDLSRFGRNSWEVGKYIEQIFPFLNVRFISVNDLLDSAYERLEDNMLLPFKNIINEAYSRDISQKVRSQFVIKRKKGDFIGNFAPYGYKKSESNRNRLVIDEEVANIIKSIFKWKIEGITNAKIAEKLNSLGVLAPMDYKNSIGLNYNTVFKRNKKTLWEYNTINRILVNEVYIGHTVQGKKKSPNLKVKKHFDVHKDEWIKVCDTHEPIISISDFNLVQELLKNDTKKSPNADSLHIFSGILKCKDCGDTMVRSIVKSKGKIYTYYICSTYKYKKSCTNHRIAENKLIKATKAAINNEISYVIQIEDVVQKIDKLELKNITISNLSKQFENLENEIKNYEKYKKGLIETYSKKLIDENFFISNMKNYSSKIEEVEQQIENLKAEITEAENREYKLNNIAENFKKYKGFNELTRSLVISLIEKIEVSENKEITISFKHSDDCIMYKELVKEVINGESK